MAAPDMSAFSSVTADAMAASCATFGAWGEGKFKTNLPKEEFEANIAAHFTEDCVCDWSGPASEKWRAYSQAKEGEMLEIFSLIDSIEFTNIEPSWHSGPDGTNEVYLNFKSDSSYGSKFGPFEMCLRHVVTDGKVSGLKCFWIDIPQINDMFA